MPGSRIRRVRAATALGVIAIVAAAMAQSPDRPVTDATARRVNERIRALQAEAHRLASQSRTLLADLRQLLLPLGIAARAVKTATHTLAEARARRSPAQREPARGSRRRRGPRCAPPAPPRAGRRRGGRPPRPPRGVPRAA